MIPNHLRTIRSPICIKPTCSRSWRDSWNKWSLNICIAVIITHITRRIRSNSWSYGWRRWHTIPKVVEHCSISWLTWKIIIIDIISCNNLTVRDTKLLSTLLETSDWIVPTNWPIWALFLVLANLSDCLLQYTFVIILITVLAYITISCISTLCTNCWIYCLTNSIVTKALSKALSYIRNTNITRIPYFIVSSKEYSSVKWWVISSINTISYFRHKLWKY